MLLQSTDDAVPSAEREARPAPTDAVSETEFEHDNMTYVSDEDLDMTTDLESVLEQADKCGT